MTEMEKQQLIKFARNEHASLTKKYDSFKKEIIASFGKMCDMGFGRFPKAMKIKVCTINKEEKMTFTGLKKLDGHVYFENNRKKVLYDCYSTVSVDELMRVLEEINERKSR